MAVRNPAKIPKKNIGSVDITGFSGGLFLNGEQNAKGNQIVEGHDVEMTVNGFLTPRRSLTPWLPDTDEDGYQVYPAIWEGEVLNFTADDGKIRYCQDGDDDWTDCGGDNTITTQNGGKPIFLRILDVLLVLNGGNGDKLCYVRLSDKAVVKYNAVADPVAAPTAAPTGITNSGAFKIYYGYTFSSATGETKISPILTYTINKPRDTWKTDGTEYLTVTRPAGNPANATKWNLYIALASTGGTIQDTDMLLLAGGLDLATTSVTDNGTLAVDIGRGNPPAVNSTDGPKVKYGIETNGRPVLFGDVDDPHNIWIGGDGDYALDFSSSNGGFRSQPSKGTNYYPASVIGFRNGQGIPSLTILFSNTQGISKQATLEQQTINYGNQSFVVWGVTEQNYGAAGVASALGVVNYKGQLSFPSVDGFTSMDTQPQLQNVIATKEIDLDITPYSERIKVEALDEIVGTGWGNRVLWIVPSYGFDRPNHILIRDLNNNGAWNPPLEIPADWIGTVSPPNSPAFVYIRQGKKTFKLFESFGTVDYKGAGPETFSTYAKGALIGINDARNAFQAVVQAMFYIVGLIGNIRIGVNYRDQDGEMQTEFVDIEGPEYVLSSSGNWSDPQYTYAGFAAPAGWSPVAQIDDSASVLVREDIREPVPINNLASEVQWWIQTEAGYNDYLLRVVSYEGENLGVKPDLR
jgi:hypothetical protein